MDSRDWASLIWIGLAVVGCLAVRGVRSSLGSVVRAALAIKILAPILFLALWTAALTTAGWRIGIWEPSFTFSTVAWFFGSALVFLFNIDKVWTSESFLRTTVLRLIGAAAFVAFFMNVFTLNLVAELFLQPIVVFLAMVAVVARRDPVHKAAERVADSLMAMIGFSLAIFTVVQLVTHWDGLDKRVLGLELAVPAWLTLATLPLIGAFAVYAAYESAFLRINHAVAVRRERRRAKFAVVCVLRLHLRDVSAFSFYCAREAGTAATGRDARRVVRQFQDSRRADERAKVDAAAKLVRNAGVIGTDGEGRQLDQREFAETRDALRWLAGCQMGWYRNQGGRYRVDMLDILDHDFSRQGLPEDHGIELHVARDGRSWWAGRRTITGWCFAIGAAGPPPDQWEYDGPEPPNGFPGVAPQWGDRPFAMDAAVNW